MCYGKLIAILNINATKNFNVGAMIVSPKRNYLHVTYRSLKSVNPFLHDTPFTRPPNPMLYNCPDTPKVPLLMGAATFPCNTGYLDWPYSASETASRLVQPFLHSSRQRVPVLMVCVKMRGFVVQQPYLKLEFLADLWKMFDICCCTAHIVFTVWFLVTFTMR